MIHPILPFLPHEQQRLQSYLTDVSPNIRKAFLSALHMFAYPGRYDPIPDTERSYLEPANLVVALQYRDSASRTTAEKLVVLQTFLFMILATEMTGPTNTENRGWYSQAFSAASFLFPHLRCVHETGRMQCDGIDEHHLLGRRTWFVFVILERWHAAGTACESICSDELTELVANDRLLLGDVGHSLLREFFQFINFSTTLTNTRLIFRPGSYHGR